MTQQERDKLPEPVRAWLEEERYPDENSTAETMLRKLVKLMELENGGL